MSTNFNNVDFWSTGDTLGLIIPFLNPREICRFNQVSKTIQSIINNLCIWENVQYDSKNRFWMAQFYSKTFISQINIREALDMQLQQNLNFTFRSEGIEFDQIPKKWRDKLNQKIKEGTDSHFKEINAERFACITVAAKIYTLPELRSMIKWCYNPVSLSALKKMPLLIKDNFQIIKSELMQEIEEEFRTQMDNLKVQDECCITQTPTTQMQEEMQSRDILKKEEDTLENRLEVATICSKLYLKFSNMKAQMQKWYKESLVEDFKDLPEEEKLNQIHQMIKRAVENKADRINSVTLKNTTSLLANCYTLPEIKEMIRMYSDPIESLALQKMNIYIEQAEQGMQKIGEILSAVLAPIDEILQDQEFVTDLNHLLGNEDEDNTQI